MLRKALAILILTSMALHCAGRLGVLSYMYANRAELAFQIGLSDERPISMCQSDHFQKTQLTLQTEKGKTLPAEIASAQDINLCMIGSPLSLSSIGVSVDEAETDVVSHLYSTPYSEIFHPPGFLA